jgi:hypothetical protein
MQKSFESRILADLQRQKHHPIVTNASLLGPTLIKKYAELLSRDMNPAASQLPRLGGGQNSSPHLDAEGTASRPQHKSTVEKILQRHSRERSAWSHLVDEDTKSCIAEKQVARQTREEQIRIQRSTLDIQIAEQEQKREKMKAEEAAYLESVLAKQDADHQRSQMEAAEKKVRQRERRKEAERVAADVADLRRRQLQALKDAEKLVAQSFLEDEKRRRDEDAARRLKAQAQISTFVAENEELLKQKRAHSSLDTKGGRGASSSFGSGRCSALPTGTPPVKNEELVEKANLLTQRRAAAAQAYLSAKRNTEGKLRAQEDNWAAQFVAKAQRESEASAEAEAKKKYQSAKYARDLREQVTLHQNQVSQEKEQDHLAREQLEYAVKLAELEERELHERERDQKRRTLLVLKTQQDAQKAIRSAFDVTPKVY